MQKCKKKKKDIAFQFPLNKTLPAEQIFVQILWKQVPDTVLVQSKGGAGTTQPRADDSRSRAVANVP